MVERKRVSSEFVRYTESFLKAEIFHTKTSVGQVAHEEAFAAQRGQIPKGHLPEQRFEF